MTATRIEARLSDDYLREAVSRLSGLFAGQLNDDERLLLDEACKRGIARRRYDGAAGMLGLAKVECL